MYPPNGLPPAPVHIVLKTRQYTNKKKSILKFSHRVRHLIYHHMLTAFIVTSDHQVDCLPAYR